MAGKIFQFSYHELNTSGSQISELINVDWKNSTKTVIKNNAADAPANSDIAWHKDAIYLDHIK